MLEGTPMLLDAQTNTPVQSGDPTIFSMMHLAYSFGVRVALAQLHPSCGVFDQRFQQMIVGMTRQQAPPTQQAPRTPEEMVEQLMSSPVPRTIEERQNVLKRVNEILGFVPP